MFRSTEVVNQYPETLVAATNFFLQSLDFMSLLHDIFLVEMYIPSSSWDDVPTLAVQKDVDDGVPHKHARLSSSSKRNSISRKLLRKDIGFGGFAPTELDPIVLAPPEPVPKPRAAVKRDRPAPKSTHVRDVPRPAPESRSSSSVPVEIPANHSISSSHVPVVTPETLSLVPTASNSPRPDRKRKLPKAFADNPKPTNSAPSSNFVYQDLKKSRKSGVKSNKGAETLRLKLSRQRKSRWREANGIIPRGRKAKQMRKIEMAKELAHEKSINETISDDSLAEMFSSGVNIEFVKSMIDQTDTELGLGGTPLVPRWDGRGVTPSDSELIEFLSTHFAHTEFRTGQLEAIKSTLSGTRSLVVLPTGTGKSLCYQFPSAYIRQTYNSCALTIVVSPLIALMADQLKQLPKICRGAVLHSNLSPAQSSLVARAVKCGEIDMLFLAPERLLMYSMRDILGANDRVSASVFLMAVDEAHCLSEWSHSFRPAYLRIPKLIDEEIKPSSLLALTATATVQTIESISGMLGIENVVRADAVDHADNGPQIMANRFSSIQRRNLELFARRSPNPSMDILEFLNEQKTISPVIIYVSYQWQTESVSQMLRERGLGTAEAYHGGLTAKERKSVYDKFMTNQLRSVVATIAFGMGIDKSDVRAVVHLTIPKSVESYVQETGRCSRDNKTIGFCRCYFNADDYARIRNRMVVDLIREDSVGRVVRMALTGEKLEEDKWMVETENDRFVYIPEKIPNIISSQHLSLVLALLEKNDSSVRVFQGFPKLVKLRFFQTPMSELAEIDPFVDALFHSPHKGTKPTVSESGGVATVDVLTALVKTGLTPPMFMHKLYACSRAQKFSTAKSDWGHFVFTNLEIDPTRATELISTCYAAASANQFYELNRLDASFALVSRIAAESLDDPEIGHKLIQQYFEAEERMNNGDDLVPSLLQGAPEGFKRNILREINQIRNNDQSNN
jgi:RecQ family ATP-dependent DNA helicase